MLSVPVEARCRHGHSWPATCPVYERPGKPGRWIIGPIDGVRPDCPHTPFSQPEAAPCGAPACMTSPPAPERLEQWREGLLEGGRAEQPVRHRNG